MLYMKVRTNFDFLFAISKLFVLQEMRPKVVAECTLKESAAINQILGRKVRPLKLGFGDCSCFDYFSGTLSPGRNKPNIMNR